MKSGVKQCRVVMKSNGQYWEVVESNEVKWRVVKMVEGVEL